MRTAAICPTCATFTNSLCVIYNGVYLSNINASPLDPLDTILTNINVAIGATNATVTNISSNVTAINNSINTINNTISGLYPLFGIADPIQNSAFIGQQYINTTTGQMFFSTAIGGLTVWQAVCNCNPIGSRIFSNAFALTFN
jgi:hypothetical protein